MNPGFKRMLQSNTLMIRLIKVMVVNILIPILLIGGISFYSLFSILQNKIERGVQSKLDEVRQGMQTAMDNLSYASKQLTLDGEIGKLLEQYLNPAVSGYEKTEIQSEIQSRLTLISYANQGLGAMFYYIPEQNQTLFETMLIGKNKNPMDYPVLISQPLSMFQAPHPSIYQFNDNMVLSIVQEMSGIPNLPKTYIYIETNYKLLRDLLSADTFGFHAQYLIIGKDGQVIYSENPDKFPLGTNLGDPKELGAHKVVSGLQLFKSISPDGWSVVAAVPARELSGEVRVWFARLLIITLISLAVSLLLAWLTWRSINQQLLHLKREIQLISNYEFDQPYVPTSVAEFDDLLFRFHAMRRRIRELLVEVEEKERKKRRLEVQKLMHQINPHFIHNTLNTIQWIARMNKQEEIVSLISVFSRILHYNLGKGGDWVKVRDEIEALRDYVSLQRIRYNHQFQVEIDVEEETLELPIIRFLIQPLVENAMYHGFTDNDGSIFVRVHRLGDEHFVVEVEDDGKGFDSTEIEKMLNEDRGGQKTGLGVGLRFVNQTIQEYFGYRYRLEISSVMNQGTLIRIELPILDNGGLPYEDINRG